MTEQRPVGPSPKGLKGWLQRHAEVVLLPAGRPLPSLAEPGKCQVVLQVTGARPIQVIKVIREATGRDILSARDLSLEAPVVVVTGISQASADRVVARLEKAGAKAVANC